ncbi:interferon-induced protein 44-like [Centropristis striata]|uniref:interferon-induced protein 44-like n=1 Tax=Centropristis striata TaxID=184440 RepID=UPI0027E20B62|nr:interferon-induced protein 44-like [Centropristis striata]
MRENLIFSGIPEQTPDDPDTNIKTFMAAHLNLSPDTINKITFHRVHRLGRPSNKGVVKSKGKELKGKPDEQEDLTFVKNYQPKEGATHLRILLHGPVGAGKSSFINSVDSVLQGRITDRALTDATSGSSFTKKYKTYKIHKGPDDFYSFVFNDTMGFEKDTNTGVLVEDVKLALKGHVEDGYKFSPSQELMEGDKGYRSAPTLDDKVHVLVCVLPVGSVSLISEEVVKKMREVRYAASDMGIPQLAILTKVDEACPKTNRNIKDAYKSKYLKQQVDAFSLLLGLPQSSIFLVKNYGSDGNMNDDNDVLILSALRKIITSGEDFLNDL